MSWKGKKKTGKGNRGLTCSHCGTPLRPEQHGSGFCCTGCEYVAGLIQEEGLTRFYDLQDGPPTPVSPGILRPVDDRWLVDAVEEAEKSAELKQCDPILTLDLQGISCTGCVWLIDRLFARSGPVGDLDLHPQRGQLTIEWKRGDESLLPFFRLLRTYGYTVAEAGQVEDNSSRLVGRMGLCGALAMNTMLFTLPDYLGMDDDFPFADLFRLIAMACATLSFLIGGGWFFQRAWQSLREKLLPIDVPIALGLIVAYSGSLYGYFFQLKSYLYFDFVAVFVFLMMVGRWVHEKALERNRNRVKTLGLAGQKYDLILGEKMKKTPLQGIKKEAIIRLRSGQILPVSGRLLQDAEFSLESINGEANPRVFKSGSIVPSGAMLALNQSVDIRVEEEWQGSLLQRLTSAKADARRNEVMEKVLKIYIASVLLLAAGGWLFWGFALQNWLQGGQVLLSVLVVSCPCAMGVAYPLINDLSNATLRRFGVYLRETSFWGRLARIRTIVFDKTGTLTLETMKLKNPGGLEVLNDEERSVLLAMVYHSFHPVGRSLREVLVAKGVQPMAASSLSLEDHPGKGVRCRWENRDWTLGRIGWGGTTDPDLTRGSVNMDGSMVEFSTQGKSVVVFHFEERVRSGAAAELKTFRAAGYETVILSGDSTGSVQSMAKRLELPPEDAMGELSPEDKQEWIEKKAQGPVLMIGDGLNDTLAFEAAHARGTPLLDRGLLESRSDFFFTGSDLRGLRQIFHTNRIRKSTLLQVFSFAVFYNLTAISICMVGWMNPLLAAIIMPISSIITLSWTGWRFRGLN